MPANLPLSPHMYTQCFSTLLIKHISLRSQHHRQLACPTACSSPELSSAALHVCIQWLLLRQGIPEPHKELRSGSKTRALQYGRCVKQ